MSFRIKNQRTGQFEILGIDHVLAAMGNPVDDEVMIGNNVYVISSCEDNSTGGHSDVRFALHNYEAAPGMSILKLQYASNQGFLQVFHNGKKLLSGTQFNYDLRTATVKLNAEYSATIVANDRIEVYYAHNGTLPIEASEIGTQPAEPMPPVEDMPTPEFGPA